MDFGGQSPNQIRKKREHTKKKEASTRRKAQEFLTAKRHVFNTKIDKSTGGGGGKPWKRPADSLMANADRQKGKIHRPPGTERGWVGNLSFLNSGKERRGARGKGPYNGIMKISPVSKGRCCFRPSDSRELFLFRKTGSST